MQGKNDDRLLAENAALRQRIADLESALAAHQQTQAALHAIYSSTVQGFVLLDRDKQVLAHNARINEIARTLWGQTITSGQTVEVFYDNVPPDAVQAFEQLFERVLEGQGLTAQGCLLTQDGTPLWLQVDFMPVQVEGQSTSGVFLGLLDITDHKKAEAEIKQLSQFREAVIENANVHVSALDADQNFILWNRGAERITGYTREEVLGHNKVWEWAYPDDTYRHEVATKAAAVAEGDPTEGLQLTLRTKNGQYKTLAFYSRQMVDSEGKLAGIVNIGIDITARKEAEQALLDSERKLRSILDLSHDGISLVDELGRVIEWSPGHERITGLPRAEVAGQWIWDVLYRMGRESDRTQAGYERTKSLSQIALQTGTGRWLNQPMEVPIQRPDGTERVIQSLVFPIPTESGFMLGGIHRDITKQKEAEEYALQLVVEQNRLAMLKRLIDDVSHDFKTPLTTIRLNLHLLEHLTDPDRRQRQIDVLNGQITHLSQMVADLLSMSRLDQMTELKLTPVDLNALGLAIVTEHELLAAQKVQHLTFQPCTPAPILQADREKLRRAIVNILSNAIYYTPAGGDIDLSTGLEAEHACIRITDTGPGIDAADLPHIFDPFYRVKHAHSTNRGGMGLGLAIAQNIVEAHGGHIEVESVLEQGTTFYIWLPTQAEDS